MEVTGGYNLSLVALSYAVSVIGAFTSLRLIKDIRSVDAGLRWIWLLTAAFAMGGCAIWSMHFIGMLAYESGMEVGYDLPLTVLSIVVAVAVTGFGLWLVATDRGPAVRFGLGGTTMGLGVALMHYTGMEAMRMPMDLSYDPLLFWLSVAIAITASVAALFLLSWAEGLWLTLGSAAVMGVAVCGMHYTGMAAAIFTPSDDMVTDVAGALSPDLLAYAVFTVSLVILFFGLVLGGKQPELDFEANA